MFPGVELRLYRYVSVLAEELNFTQAAMRLHVSQPTLSTQIRDLERELDVRLFERSKGGQQVRLTAAGEAFASEARLALLHAERAVQNARNSRGERSETWTLGYSPLIDFHIVHKIQRFLYGRYPSANLTFLSGHSAEHVDALIRGNIHVGIVVLTPREERVVFHSFLTERLLLAMPKEHPLATKRQLEITDLHQLPLVQLRGDIEPRFGKSLRTLFSLIRIEPRLFHRATTQAEALDVVTHHSVAALLTPAAQQSAGGRIVFRNFSDEILTINTGIAHLSETVSPMLEALKEFLAGHYGMVSGEASKKPLEAQMKLFDEHSAAPIWGVRKAYL